MEHVRIDEGIKRPRKKPGRKPSSPRRNNGDFLPILSNKPEDIKAALQDYINGATLEQIGKRHGVSRQAVYGWLLGELGGQEHADLVTRALTARIARADEFLETGENALDVTRGERMARHYRTDLERRRSSLYGQKQEVTVTHNTDLGERLRRARERSGVVVDAEVVPVQQVEDKT